MNNDNFNELLEQQIDNGGLSEIVKALAEICRNRGNVLREDGPPHPAAAKLWTYYGAILFNAADAIGSNTP